MENISERWLPDRIHLAAPRVIEFGWRLAVARTRCRHFLAAAGLQDCVLSAQETWSEYRVVVRFSSQEECLLAFFLYQPKGDWRRELGSDNGV